MAQQIDTNIPIIEDYPRLGDIHSVFREKADIAWAGLYALAPKLQQFAQEANALSDEVNTWGISLQDAIYILENTVIPTETTYSFGQIDAFLEGKADKSPGHLFSENGYNIGENGYMEVWGTQNFDNFEGAAAGGTASFALSLPNEVLTYSYDIEYAGRGDVFFEPVIESVSTNNIQYIVRVINRVDPISFKVRWQVKGY